MADAAQDFLDKQLSKNRFTAKQQERLDNSGGAAVTNASEGIVPAGEAYAKYGKMPTALTDKAGDTSTGGSTPAAAKAYSGPDKRNDMFAEDTDWGRNYRAGIYGGGDYNAQELAKRYGLDNSKEAEAKGGEENIYGTRADGSSVFLGRMSMDLASNSELIKAHSKQRHQNEGDHLAEGGNLDSMGDITGALLASWNEGEAAVEAEPEKERTPIEHSPEIKQAKERVRAYEDDIMSGKTSDDIFGSNDFDGDTSNIGESNDYNTPQTNVLDRINNKYQINFNSGAAGIGTPNSGAQAEAPAKAAESFLTSQKSSVKKDYNFKPSYTYGQN